MPTRGNGEVKIVTKEGGFNSEASAQILTAVQILLRNICARVADRARYPLAFFLRRGH